MFHPFSHDQYLLLNAQHAFVLIILVLKHHEWLSLLNQRELIGLSLQTINEFQQSISDIKDVEVIEVVDHHRVGNFETANPLMMRLEPVGSASSIVFRMFKENNVEVPKEVAGLLLSGLISDTLLLKSPTTYMRSCSCG